MPIDGWVALPFGRIRQQRHPRPDAEQLVGQLRRRNGYVGQLLHGRLGYDAAIPHEQHPVVPKSRVLHFHHHATGRRRRVRGHLDDLEQRAQDAAGALIGARDKAVHLVHRQHHRAVIIRIEHRLPRLLLLHPLVTAQQLVAFDESGQVLALRWVDDAHPFQRNVQFRGGLLDLRAVPQQDRRPQPQRIKLPGRLQHARLGPSGKTTRLGCRCSFSMILAINRMGALVLAKGRSSKPKVLAIWGAAA